MGGVVGGEAAMGWTTGSDPSWSCLLHFYFYLVHFYGVIESK
jgi:hypothetical protein